MRQVTGRQDGQCAPLHATLYVTRYLHATTYIKLCDTWTNSNLGKFSKHLNGVLVTLNFAVVLRRVIGGKEGGKRV